MYTLYNKLNQIFTVVCFEQKHTSEKFLPMDRMAFHSQVSAYHPHFPFFTASRQEYRIWGSRRCRVKPISLSGELQI